MFTSFPVVVDTLTDIIAGRTSNPTVGDLRGTRPMVEKSLEKRPSNQKMKVLEVVYRRTEIELLQH